MPSVNKVILIGHLGKDPELRYTPSGEPVANFSVATSYKYKNKGGETVEQTEWHNITCWGRIAEIARDYLKKGNPVYIEGRIKYSSYDDKDGIKRYKTEIVAQSLQLLGSKPSNGAKDHPSKNEETPTPSSDDDDLPF